MTYFLIFYFLFINIISCFPIYLVMRLGNTALYFSQPTDMSVIYATVKKTEKSSHQPKKTTISVISSNRQFNVDQFPFADNKPKNAHSRPNSVVDDAKMYVYYEEKVETVVVSNSTKNQQNEQSPPTLTQRTQKLIYYVGNTHNGLGQARTHM